MIGCSALRCSRAIESADFISGTLATSHPKNPRPRSRERGFLFDRPFQQVVRDLLDPFIRTMGATPV